MRSSNDPVGVAKVDLDPYLVREEIRLFFQVSRRCAYKESRCKKSDKICCSYKLCIEKRLLGKNERFVCFQQYSSSPAADDLSLNRNSPRLHYEFLLKNMRTFINRPV